MPKHSAHDMITDQIARELDKLNTIFTDEEDKPAIIQRIAELKALLDSPSTEKPVESSEPTVRNLIADIIKAFRNR